MDDDHDTSWQADDRLDTSWRQEETADTLWRPEDTVDTPRTIDEVARTSRVIATTERLLRRGAVAVATGLAMAALPYVPAYAAPVRVPGPAPERSVPVHRLLPRQPVSAQTDGEQWKPTPVTPPAGGSAVVDVVAAPAAGSRPTLAVGGLPVRVSRDAAAPAPQRVRVEVFDPARTAQAGAAAVLRVSRADALTGSARTRVELDYSGIQGRYGAAWASRLRLVRLADCVTDRAGAWSCATVTPLAGRNDPVRRVASTTVDISSTEADSTARLDGQTDATLVALVSGTSSETGTFARTSFASSSSWSAGRQGGDFTWSYDLDVPESAGGLDPDISLDYSSARVDGQTNGENTQASWIGEGWDFNPGYIERFYRQCRDDTANSPAYTNATTDLCWRDHNVTLVVDGQSTELVRDDATGTWRKSNDDGTKIEYLTGGTSSTRNWNNERWILTTPDGTRYHYGRNWIDSRETQSVLGAPVFSNHTTDPCYKTGGFAGSWCSMAYRWNLDMVEEPTGDIMSFFYSKEGNRTNRAGNTSAVTSYDRAATLARIEYGSRGFPQPTTPSMQVLFTTADRCLSSCWSSSTVPNTANWPETPWDLNCPGTTCAVNGPTFWSARRLESVKVQVLSGGAYVDVDTWRFTHQFPSTGEDTALTSPALWLASITRTGGSGTNTLSLPTITFGGTRYANRTDYNVTAGVPVTNKYRITSVSPETGEQLLVTYQGSDCTTTVLPNPDSNSMRCFPQYYTPPDNVGGWSWWNKYRVTQVTERDLVGGTPDMVTTYGYGATTTVGPFTVGSTTTVLWHHNDNAWAAPLSKRSWSEFRGWPVVTVTSGASGGTQSQSRYIYFTGLDGDRTDAGDNTRSVSLLSSDSVRLADLNSYAGMLREQIDFSAANGEPITRNIYGPWRQRTALRVEDPAYASPSTFEAWYAEPRMFHTYEWIETTGYWRQSEVFNDFDTTYGTVTKTTDNGDTDVTGDERCTTYTYARNTSPGYWMIDYPAEEIVTDCSATLTPANVYSGTRTYYDGSTTLGAAPTKGLETRTDELHSYTSSTANWITTETATYDDHGRVKTSTDGEGATTRTDYTPATGSPVTAVTETNAAGHATVENLNVRGQPTSVVDANGKTTTAQYDPLGRLTKVWESNRPTAATPDREYVYSVTKTAPSVVETRQLGANTNQISGFEIYDGHLRLRQSQTVAPDGKRVIADRQYDSRGLESVESLFYNSASGPTGTLLTFANADVAAQHRYTYDGAERPTADELWSRDALKWATTATYDGDRINVDPPTGGMPITLIEDALGRTVSRREYQGSSPTGSYDETSYRYDRLDRLTSVTDPAGNTWTNTYDRLDRLASSVDPDTGTSTYTYDNADQLVTSQDGRGEVLFRRYDQLGRMTELRDDDANGALRASWVYDTVALGEITSATRYVNGEAYVQQVDGYTDTYQPTSRTDRIPAGQGVLAGDYRVAYDYYANGALLSTIYPAKGGLPEETVQYTYTNQGYLDRVNGLATYLASANYHWDGQAKQQILGSGTNRVRLSTTMGESTGRIFKSDVYTERPGSPNTWDEKLTEDYTYDQDGNVTGINENSAGTTVSNQCFRYDHLQRLTEAWTTTATNCQAAPSQAVVGGVDAYWQSFRYDKTGNRVSDTRHSATGDTTRDYGYPTPGSARPHTLSSVTTVGGGPSSAYTYDNSGNLRTRTSTGSPDQTLTFDAEGHLRELQSGTTKHTYLYDADGDRIVADDPATRKTLYTEAGEFHLDHATGQVTATRYYPNAVRTNQGLTWVAADLHGTNELAVDAGTLAVARRRLTPFGEVRGTPAGSWPDDKGLVGGVLEPTGYIHLGAREYDPTTGRFLSADPELDTDDPQSMNGYAYADNNPVTYADPDGRSACKDCVGGGGGVAGGRGSRGPNIPSRGGANGGASSARAGSYRGSNPRMEARQMQQMKNQSRMRGRQQTQRSPKRKTSGGRNGSKGNSKGSRGGKGRGGSRSKSGSSRSKAKSRSGNRGRGGKGTRSHKSKHTTTRKRSSGSNGGRSNRRHRQPGETRQNRDRDRHEHRKREDAETGKRRSTELKNRVSPEVKTSSDALTGKTMSERSGTTYTSAAEVPPAVVPPTAGVAPGFEWVLGPAVALMAVRRAFLGIFRR